jgi:arabinogalactan endo-1,4-beta-galactosidase
MKMRSLQSRCTYLLLALVFVVTTVACQASPSPEPTVSQDPTKIAAPVATVPASPTATIPPSPTLPPTPTSAPRPTPTIPPRIKFHVNPIDGLGPDFILGADISMLGQIEKNGGKFYDYGVERDCLEILRDYGVNWIRLRIWNDPMDENGEPLGGGNNDLDQTVEIAARAKALGFKFLLDFHYSDWWADPGRQNMPKAWVDLDMEQLEQAIYDYTAEVIQTLADADAMPDMVQIGNEVNNGMMWPAGKTYASPGEEVGGYDGLAALLSQGVRAVRDHDPSNGDPEERIKIAIHLADGGNNELYRTVFDELTARDVDFDVIGLSYYSFWHGPMDRFIANMNDVAERYQKDVAVMETAYPYTPLDGDGHANFVGGTDDVDIDGPYLATVQGQATAMRDMIVAVAEVPNDRGLGIFYWEPAWIPVEGAGWATIAGAVYDGMPRPAVEPGNAWDNMAMFDFDGNVLPSLNVFKLVRPEAGGDWFDPIVRSVYSPVVYAPLGEAPELPKTVQVLYNDDAIRKVPVSWGQYDPALLDVAGSFTLRGMVARTNQGATITIYMGSPKNFVENAGFESGLDAWLVEGSTSAVKIGREPANARSGDFALNYWLAGEFEFTLSQTITGLENGTYTLSAWIQGGGGDAVQLYASDYGVDTLAVDFELTGWQDWHNPTIENIVVTNGQCTIGLKVVSEGNTWAWLDDVELFLNE